MRCDFQSTGEFNARGLPKLRCTRAGCANVCFTHHRPEAIRFQCKHPALFELGEFAAAAIKTATREAQPVARDPGAERCVSVVREVAARDCDATAAAAHLKL